MTKRPKPKPATPPPRMNADRYRKLRAIVAFRRWFGQGRPDN